MGKLQVLIANESANNRAQIRLCVEKVLEDAAVCEAVDGLEVINKAWRQRFDLIVLSRALPKRDGLTVLQALEGLPSNLLPWNVLLVSEETVALEEYRKTEPALLLRATFPDGMIKYLKERFVKPPSTEAASASAPAPGPAPAYDLKMMNAFIESTIFVLEANAQVSVQKEKIFLKGAEESSGDISALISIAGLKQRGSMAIAFESNCFLAVVNRMLGENHQTLCDELNDAAAELCNQIFGHTKQKLNEIGYQIQPAIPSVISGKMHRITHTVPGPCVAVKFRTELGSFVIEAATKDAA